MCKRNKINVLALFFMAISLPACSGNPTTEVQEENYIQITVGNNHITAATIGEEIAASYLVVGGSGYGFQHATAHLAVIPLDVAMNLAEKYGDFRDCDSPGASAGKRETTSMFLYATNADIKRVLASIDELAKAYKDPIVKMSFREIEIVEHTTTLLGKEVEVDSSGLGPNYLVTDVQLVEEDHRFEE